MLLSVFSETGYFMKFEMFIDNLFDFQELLINKIINNESDHIPSSKMNEKVKGLYDGSFEFLEGELRMKIKLKNF
jgi:hypothetical protein